MVLALPFDVGARMVAGIVERDESVSESAHAHLQAALASRAQALPKLSVVSLAAPADRASLTERERELDALVDAILRTGYVGRTTVEASLGPVLAAWGQRVGAEELLIGRGLSVLPSEVWDRRTSLDSDESRTTTVGFLQLALVLIDLPTDDVLWMDLHDELIGDEQAVWWPDVRNAWVSEKIVGELLGTFPVSASRRADQR